MQKKKKNKKNITAQINNLVRSLIFRTPYLHSLICNTSIVRTFREYETKQISKTVLVIAS